MYSSIFNKELQREVVFFGVHLFNKMVKYVSSVSWNMFMLEYYLSEIQI